MILSKLKSEGSLGPARARDLQSLALFRVYLAGGIAPGGGGAGGLAKLPACRRDNSSWFSWLALVPVIAEGGCFLMPTW